MNREINEDTQKESALMGTVLRLAQLSMPLVLSALIPWGTWVTYKTITFEEWKNLAPRWTSKDADAMRLEVKQWTVEMLEKSTANTDRKLDSILKDVNASGKDIIELKGLLREHEARTAKMMGDTKP